MKKEVLIVEDDPQMHAIYKDMLDPEKFNITSVYKPMKALSMIQDEKRRFDVILLDILMEDSLFDGRTFFVQLREVLKNTTPVIVVTVLNTDQVDDLKIINNISFLRKPIAQKELLSEIDQKISTG